MRFLGRFAYKKRSRKYLWDGTPVDPLVETYSVGGP